MSQKSKIEWTDTTWNPVRGCTRVSPGCMNCYAERQAIRQAGEGHAYEGLVHIANGHPSWTGKIAFVEEHLEAPLHWRTPSRVFVNSMSDLFHEGITDDWIDQIFAVMAATPQHTYQILTKRPERMLDYFTKYTYLNVREAFIGQHISRRYLARTGDPVSEWPGLPLPNVWLGTSVENQMYADQRIPLLLKTPAAVRFISAEPLLGPINLGELPSASGIGRYLDSLSNAGVDPGADIPSKLDWVIVGGESGPGARPMHPDWVRSLRNQCKSAGVAFFFKQWGAWVKYVDRDVEDPDWRQNYTRMNRSDSFRILNLAGGSGFHGDRVHVMQRVGKTAAGSLLDGLICQEFPEVRLD